MFLLWLIATAGFLVSVVSAFAVDTLLWERISIFGDLIGLERSVNAGIAFGIALSPLLQSTLIFLALIAVLCIATHSRGTLLQQTGFGLIVGGGLANIVDRFSDGLVTDFIQVGTFPVFNIADSCITIGVLLLFLEMVMERARGK
jgi:signal peptidase II